MQPSITGPTTLNGTTNNTVYLPDIVTILGLERGDVIRIEQSGYDKLHTVDFVTSDSMIRVNFYHAGNQGDGSLRLPDLTGNTTITRVAKWYNAPVGMGQAWVEMTAFRWAEGTFSNITGRPIQLSVTFDPVGDKPHFMVDNVNVLSNSDTPYYQVFCIVPHGSTYKMLTSGGIVYEKWVELR